MPSFERAAKRNVNVELLWGQRTDELPDWSQEALRDTRKIFESLSPAIGSKVRFSKNETGSHAKLILADSGPNGAYETYISSCNCLSARYRFIEASVRIRDPLLVGYVAALLAALRTQPSGPWGPDVYRLVHVYSACHRTGRKG